MAKRRRSRLVRKEEVRNLRQAILFGFLTILIALGIIFLGIPAMIRLAIFLGEIRSSSQPVEAKDIIPPAPVRFQPLPEASSQNQITIEGFAEAGSTVEIFINDFASKKVVAENDGTFKAREVNLNAESIEIYATATDQAGNISQKSELVTVYFDNVAPELEIIEPPQNAEFFGENNKVAVKGKTEPKVSLVINNRITIVDFEGNFDYSLNLSEGENVLKVVAVDKAGNTTEKEITVNYSP